MGISHTARCRMEEGNLVERVLGSVLKTIE